MAQSIVTGVYEKAVDRESAYEKLKERVAQTMPDAADMDGQDKNDNQAGADEGGFGEVLGGILGGASGNSGSKRGRRSASIMETMMKSEVRNMGRAEESRVGNECGRTGR